VVTVTDDDLLFRHRLLATNIWTCLLTYLLTYLFTYLHHYFTAVTE